MNPEVLRATIHSQMEINVYRSNMLGFKVPFSTVDVRFEIIEGANLIEFINESAEGNVTVRSKGVEGEAMVAVYSIKSGLPVKRVLIKILPKEVALK
jgi:hypothetical protein